MVELPARVVLRDSTLREAMDTPGVDFSLEDRLSIARTLAKLGVSEAEVVAPARVEKDLPIAERIRQENLRLATSGLIYSNRPECADQVAAAARVLDHLDLIMPLSEQREPKGSDKKIEMLIDAVSSSRDCGARISVGFPHASQVAPALVIEAAIAGVEAGAQRVIVYDTNGSAEPFAVQALIDSVVAAVEVPVHFHGHNDLGLAVANSWAAIRSGAQGLDVTLNGLGDRAGNASLEQLAMLLHLQGVETGIVMEQLPPACRLIERLSGVPVSRLAPVIGEYAFDHRSPTHLGIPREFEAFAPTLVGGSRQTGD
jgi:isopropylmalate/homocitrate/citramalate synthase